MRARAVRRVRPAMPAITPMASKQPAMPMPIVAQAVPRSAVAVGRLRATVDWSYQLLSDAEKACFARFAVFAGGATIEAAETVTGADLDTLI
jgi:hypothetical protein